LSVVCVVCTQSGQLQGAVEGAFRAFRGIPFAAPPVGDLRRRPPAPPASWQGVRSAMAFGNRCPQVDNNGPLGNEDCLTLNLYAVNPPPGIKQPVMVFIHGGAESRGSAQNVPWDLVPPLAGQGVIVVTVQYRLGLLGWLVHPLLTAEAQGSSGNYGLMDLVAALKWVHDNIAEFGGDPAKVMIFGESAGSLNVQALLASPAAAGLFSAAAMESRVLRGGLIGSSVADAYPWYAGLESLVNCDAAADVLACLRAVPADTLVQTSLNSTGTGWVNIEPSVLPEDPFNKLQRLGSAVPLLIGSNSDEEAFSYVSGPALDPSSYAASIHTQFDPLAAGAGDTILSLYPATDYTNPNYALSAVESDAHYTCDTRNLARAASDGRRPRVAISVHASLRERRRSQCDGGVSLGRAPFRVRQSPNVDDGHSLLPEHRRDYTRQRNDGLLGPVRSDGRSERTGRSSMASIRYRRKYSAARRQHRDSGWRLQERAVRFSVNPAYQILEGG
jgi:para-nitrobenzyl esterase